MNFYAKNHSLTNAFRAIENGVNLIKPTYPGSSIVTNYHGEILLDYYMNNYSYYLDKQFNLVSMPCKGKFTIYPYLALFIDYFYLCTFVRLTIGYSVYDYVNKRKK